MSEAEFRPIESAPARRLWPYAVLGAVIVGLVVYIAQKNVRGAEPRQVAVANLAPKLAEPAVAAQKTEPAVAQPAPQKAPESPNVLGAAASAAGKLAMVAKAELDRELGRTRAAQKQAEAYRKEISNLERQLNETRAQLAAYQKARQPPPPTDQEQILQMLAPVLRSSNDGRP
ncbi:MAG TPA: hypothetical protein VI356_19390 [Myxococcales bacterium]